MLLKYLSWIQFNQNPPNLCFNTKTFPLEVAKCFSCGTLMNIDGQVFSGKYTCSGQRSTSSYLTSLDRHHLLLVSNTSRWCSSQNQTALKFSSSAPSSKTLNYKCQLKKQKNGAINVTASSWNWTCQPFLL